MLKLFILLSILGLLLSAAGAAAAAGVYLHYAGQLEGQLDRLETRSLSETTKIYDRNGYLLYEVFQEGRRTRVDDLDQIPDRLIQATISVEDKTFFENPGVDPVGIARAAVLILQTGEIHGGGSTLTQQFIRNALFPIEERYAQTMERKIKEGILALELTRTYTKPEILLMYFNEIAYGNLSFGIEAAAQSYFGENVEDLELAECAFLAGLPQAPTEYNPFFEGGMDRAKSRQWDVLALMVDNEYITQDEADTAYSEELHFVTPVISIEAPHFVMYVRQLLEQDPSISLEQLYGGGLAIYTTLDIRYQRLAEEIVRYRIDPYGQDPDQDDIRTYNVNNAAVVVMRPDTGEILAMVGSVDYDLIKPSQCGHDTNVVDGNVNATLALRQPGSSFKPFTYLNAFLQGWAPSTMVLDVRTKFPVPGHPDYEPHNHDNKFHGPLSVRIALGSSENVPAVKAIQFAGVGATIDLATQMGIKGLGDPSFYGLSLTLGGGEVRLLDMVTAYSTLANEGRYVPNQAILRVEDATGNAIYEYDPLPLEDRPEVVDPNYVYLISHILSDDAARILTYGTHGSIYLPEEPAVKTGTSEDWGDNWTIGYTPYLVVGAWAGNNNNEPMSLNCAPRQLARRGMPSSRTAGRIWRYFMESIFHPETRLPRYFNDDEEAATLFNSGELRYTHYDGGLGPSQGWQIEIVDDEGWVGSHTSLALDSQDRPHISYCLYDTDNLSCTALKYAHHDGQDWQIETLDQRGVGSYSTIALDTRGRPHIVYYNTAKGILKYTYSDSDGWHINIVDRNLGESGGYASLALDARGQPHISYYDGEAKALKYAWKDTVGWHIETVAGNLLLGETGIDTSLALDSHNQPHISYPDVTTAELQYAQRIGRTWKIETISGALDEEEWLGPHTSLALDENDQPYISFCHYDPEIRACTVLKYAYYDGTDPDQGQGWHIGTVDSADHMGNYSHIALDEERQPHVSYYDYDDKDLRYARYSESGWQIIEVDSDGWVGRYNALALDGAGRPHISYLGLPTPDLRDILRDEQGNLQYDFRRPSGVVTMEVCALSGKLPTPHCPVKTDIFVEGHQPKEMCNIHKALTVVLFPGTDPPQYCLPMPGIAYPPELVQQHVFMDLPSVARLEELPGLEEWMLAAGVPRMPTEYCPADMGSIPGPGPGPDPVDRWAGMLREISSPWTYQGISGPIEIIGSADLLSARPKDQFAGYRVEWGVKNLAGWPTEWNYIHESNIPVHNGVLAYWDPDALGLPDGSYALRLTVFTKEGRPRSDGEAPGHTYKPVYLDRGGIYAFILSPVSGSTLTRNKVVIEVKVEGVSPARRVDFFYDGIFIGTAVTNTVMPLSERIYTITWPVRPGQHELTVEVVNTAGRKTSSQPVRILGQPPEGVLPPLGGGTAAAQPAAPPWEERPAGPKPVQTQ